MKFRVERDALAESVAWAARSLATRPTLPVLAGLLLTVHDGSLAISGFDLEASSQVEIEVTSGEDGSALVSGKLLAEISKALPPHPVEVSAEGPKLNIVCGSSRFTLPTMPVEDYPKLPAMPTTAGTVDSSVFSAAVQQVAIAAGRDDTLPMLTGVRLEIDGTHLTLAATDRYRLAVREFEWNPSNPSAEPVQVLVPARALSEAARSLAVDEQITISLSSTGVGEGIIGFSGGGRRATTRLLDAQFPPYRTLLPNDWSSVAEVTVAPLVESVKRVALVADRGTPVRLEFTEGSLSLSAGGENESQASEQLDVNYDSEEIVTAFNPQFLLEGLGALPTSSARLLFTSANKPVVLRPTLESDTAGEVSQEYTYLIMPVRLPG